MTDFQLAMPAAELAPGQCAERIVGGRAVALFNVDGRVFATSNLCLHRGGPLGQGMPAFGDSIVPSSAVSLEALASNVGDPVPVQRCASSRPVSCATRWDRATCQSSG